MQAPQNPLLEMARASPRAAMMLQQQMQGQQDRQWKMQEQQLKMREATADAFASKLQGVNSQESYETAVQDLMQWAPQQASRLPRVWSKEAMQPIIDSALSAKDKATLQVAERTSTIRYAWAALQGTAGGGWCARNIRRTRRSTWRLIDACNRQGFHAARHLQRPS